MSNVFRTKYRELSDSEKVLVGDIKVQAEALYALIDSRAHVYPGPRAMALAKTKLEECVMWAVKGITG